MTTALFDRVRTTAGRAMWTIAALLVLPAASACEGTSAALLDRQLESGGLVKDLVARADTAVVLVYSPSDCFLCYGALQPWLLWGRKHPGTFALLFTRPPTAAESVQLSTYRIRPNGIVRPRLTDRVSPIDTPYEMLLVRGEPVVIREIRRGTLATPLYRTVSGQRFTPDP